MVFQWILWCAVYIGFLKFIICCDFFSHLKIFTFLPNFAFTILKELQIISGSGPLNLDPLLNAISVSKNLLMWGRERGEKHVS